MKVYIVFLILWLDVLFKVKLFIFNYFCRVIFDIESFEMKNISSNLFLIWEMWIWSMLFLMGSLVILVVNLIMF